MTGPRTLHLTVLEQGGGTETIVKRLCRNVPEFHHISLEKLGAYPDGLRGYLGALRAIRAFRPEVVFCYGARSHLIACAAWPARGPALVGNIRGEIDFLGTRTLVYRLADRRVRFWVANFCKGLGGNRGVVIHNGVPEPPPGEQPLLTGLQPPVIGLLANERPMKGHRFLLDVWRHCRPAGTLVFAGRISPALRKEAEAEGIVCTGYVSAGPLLRSLDLLALPSASEGFPGVLLEAMSRGVPVAATPVGGIPELIHDGQTGFLVHRREWSNFLSRPESHPLKTVGLAGRRHVRSRFTERRMIERFRKAARLATAGRGVSA